MRYDDQELQNLLAAEFVLGNLRGAARRRLIALMQQAPGLRASVEHWEERLYPLMMNAPPVKTPVRVWRAIQARIAPGRHPAPAARRGWRRFALGGLAFALAVMLYLGVVPPGPPPFTMVAVLNDAQAKPGILMSWTPRQAAQRQLHVRILAHPDMAAGTSWQAWLTTADGGAPISLGFVTSAETQVLALSAAAAEALPKATAIGVSVEPKGGSVSGTPSGPYLFQGPALRVED